MGQMKIVTLLIATLWTIVSSHGFLVNNSTSDLSSRDVTVQFFREIQEYPLEGTQQELTIFVKINENVSINGTEEIQDGRLVIVSRVPWSMTVTNRSVLVDLRDVMQGVNYTVILQAHKLGYVTLSVFWIKRGRGQPILDDDGQWEQVDVIGLGVKAVLLEDYKVAVIRTDTTANKVFMNSLAVIVAINVFAMGAHVQLKSVKKVLRRPLGPFTGFVSQFVFMPLASYFLGWVLLDDEDMRVGLFFMGCAPGEVISNFWTLKLDGDFDLSVTMTLMNTIAAVGMMPMWIFTLGQSITSDPLKVPFMALLIALIRVTLPVAAGILLTHFKPEWSKKLECFIRPLTIFIIICTLTLGVYCNLYAFEMMSWKVFMAGIGVAWGGYTFGGALAYAFGFNKPQLLAVSIETAFQNVGLTLLAIRATLPQPDADIAVVPPIAQVLITSLPVHVCFIYFLIKNKCCGKKTKTEGDDDQGEEGREILNDANNENPKGPREEVSYRLTSNGDSANGLLAPIDYRVSKFIDEDAASVVEVR